MSKCILFIFEGQVTEHDIVKNMQQFYLKPEDDNVFILSSHCGHIYSLYHKLKNDEDLDVFHLIKSMPVNSVLKDIKRKSISEIYLFFDYDGHDPQATDNKLKEMLNFFDEETENGKLYISYPMVEALKHIPENGTFEELVVTAKENIHYKSLVPNEIHRDYNSLKKYDIDKWKELNSLHLKKANKIVNDSFSLPNTNIEPVEIFEKQLIKHITPNNQVSVLSAFPCFLLDYYGCSNIEILL
ncbi:hypothetical protein QU232_004249 [Vibrio vulnificus]|nr:hypothetical protein [Vibrio vulnificus]ELP1870029.1 hypothetical protein [Vibrio vulnificus]